MTNNLQSNIIEKEHMFDKTTGKFNYICGDGTMETNADNDENCNCKKLIEYEMDYYNKINELKENIKGSKKLVSNG